MINLISWGVATCAKDFERGEEVICMDNFYCVNQTLHLLGNPKFELMRHDVVDPLRRKWSIYNLDILLLPFTISNVLLRLSRHRLLAINCLGWQRVGARVLQASTSEVYGDPEVHPQPESYRGNVNPIGLELVMTRGKMQRRFFSITERIKWMSVLSVFSTLMVQGCCPMMDAWFEFYSSTQRGRFNDLWSGCKPALCFVTTWSKEWLQWIRKKLWDRWIWETRWIYHKSFARILSKIDHHPRSLNIPHLTIQPKENLIFSGQESSQLGTKNWVKGRTDRSIPHFRNHFS